MQIKIPLLMGIAFLSFNFNTWASELPCPAEITCAKEGDPTSCGLPKDGWVVNIGGKTKAIYKFTHARLEDTRSEPGVSEGLGLCYYEQAVPYGIDLMNIRQEGSVDVKQTLKGKERMWSGPKLESWDTWYCRPPKGGTGTACIFVK